MVASAVTALFVLLIIAFAVLSNSNDYRPPRDSLIISGIAQIRVIMEKINNSGRNYDNFNCRHEDILEWCQEIDKQYGPQDRQEPIIVHDKAYNSYSVCVYSPLNFDKYWYCADSEGNAGYTKVDPGSDGYCIEGKSAICPVFEDAVLK